MTIKRVVITGIGMQTPLGSGREVTWQAALAGKSGINKITQFDASEFASQIAGEVSDFNPEDFIDKKEARRLDRFSQLAIAASQEAWDDSGIAEGFYIPERFGCVLGVGMGGLRTLEDNHTIMMNSGPRRISPFLIPAMLDNLAPGHLGIRYGLKGVNFVVSSACTSATHALGEATRMIAYGFQDAVMTGGAESTVTELGIGGFAAMKALSTRNDDPEKASRPFDKDRDGFVLSEGSVVFLLESLDNAKKRGAKIYAEVLGYGVSCDASHITAPSGKGAEQCMQEALRVAGLNTEEIQYVNTHGTSTPVGDVAESKAVKNVFGDYAKNGLMVSSTKSMTGHLLGAAGAIEAGLCALMLQNQVVLPTINLDNPDDECDLDYVPHEARDAKLERVLSNSFGFGGTNGSLVLGRI